MHCDGLTGPDNSDGSDVEDFYHPGDMGSMTASSSGTVATFPWEDQTWAERWYDVTFYWSDTTQEEWVSFTSPSRSDDVACT